MSEPSYTAEDVTLDVLCREIESSFPGNDFKTAIFAKPPPQTLYIYFSVDLTAPEMAALDALVSAHKDSDDTLLISKNKKVAEIDERTEEVIARGFDYNGKHLSLSIPAQIKWSGAYQVRDMLQALGAFPLVVNTQDDLDTYSIADGVELEGVYKTIVGTVLTILSTDTALKDLVRAAATVVEVEAIVDNR